MSRKRESAEPGSTPGRPLRSGKHLAWMSPDCLLWASDYHQEGTESRSYLRTSHGGARRPLQSLISVSWNNRTNE